MKCLTGDKGDNVRVFQALAQSVQNSFIEQYGSAWDIYEAVPIDSKYKYIQRIECKL